MSSDTDDDERAPAILFLMHLTGDQRILCLGVEGDHDTLISREMVGWIEIGELDDGESRVIVRAREGTVIEEVKANKAEVAALERWFVGAPATPADHELFRTPGERES